MKLLLRVSHGLGDNAQFTIVLKHIKQYRPNWVVDLEISKGNSSFFTNLCNKVEVVDTLVLKLLRYVKYCKFLTKRKKYKGVEIRDSEGYKDKYEKIVDVFFPVPRTSFSSVPSTKVSWCLNRMFHIKPVKKLYQYQVNIQNIDREKVQKYISTLPNDYILLHYISKTLKQRKSLDDENIRALCKNITHKGYTPVILDWKGESSLPNQRTIFCPTKDNPLWDGNSWAEAGTLAALIEKAKLYIGIDSGPLHVAGATHTPTIAIWRKHHPINYFDLADNVMHLLPSDADENIRGKESQKAKHFFEENYNHIYYNDLHKELLKTIDKML